MGQQHQVAGLGGHHKKNQYSTIVKSNYKNLVESLSEDMEQEEAVVNLQQSNHMDLDVFQSNQNKTTEQKYAELKMKYNDLLNKHLNLAAQKTVDNRSKPTSKQPKQHVNEINMQAAQSYNEKQIRTQKQTVNQSLKQHQLGHKPVHENDLVQVPARQVRDAKTIIKSANGNVVVNLPSNFTSQNPSPRSIQMRPFDKFAKQNRSQEDFENYNGAENEGIDVNAIEGLRQTVNGLSRMEGQGPLLVGLSPLVSNKNQSDNQVHKNDSINGGRSKSNNTSYSIQHKRSASDEVHG